MDINELRRIAAKEELSLNFVAKDEMISRTLFSLQNFNNIILKGGTAINRVYLKNKRFSEDIDFDIVSNGTIKDTLNETKKIVERLDGFNIKRARIMKETIRYDIAYTNSLNHLDKIRLEFRAIKKAFNFEKRIVNFAFVPFESALLDVYDIEKLIKDKVRCVLNRQEGKDFFDLYYLIDLTHKPINELKNDKEKILKKIDLEKKQIIDVANIVNHYIPRQKRPDWDIFLEELKDKIKKYPRRF